MIKILTVNATDLNDLWFRTLVEILTNGRREKTDRGSYEGSNRIELDFFVGYVEYPQAMPLLPEVSPTLNLPACFSYEYVFGGTGEKRSYVEYIMTPTILPQEQYTYGRRLTKWELNRNEVIHCIREDLIDGLSVFQEKGGVYLNQIEWIIKQYRNNGFRNNQLVLQVSMPSDRLLDDPPCLIKIDTRIQDNQLHFFIYFRSWDVFNGMPCNLAGIEVLKCYMAHAIGVDGGQMIVYSKGAHIYETVEKLARTITGIDS